MGYILLSWIVCFAGIVGVGSGVMWICCFRQGIVRGDTCRLFFLGLGGVIAFTQLYSLVLPIGEWCLALLGLLSLPGLYLLVCSSGWRAWAPEAQNWSVVLRRGVFVLAAGYCVACAASHTATIKWTGAYDTALYHFTSVRWANEYPAVPGLGSLHGRLAVNSAFLLFAALVDNAWWDLRAAWLVNGFWVSAVVVYWLYIVVLSPGRSTPPRARLFGILAFPFIAGAVSSVEPSLYYDKPCLLLQFVMVMEMLRWRSPLEDVKENGSLRVMGVPLTSAMVTLAVITTTGALSFACKAMGLIAAAAGLLFALAALRSLFRAKCRKGMWWALALVVGLPALIIGGYLARNVILSGWLLYPAPIGKCPVEWAMPEFPLGAGHDEIMQSVRGQYQVIWDWARWGGAEGYVRAHEGNAGAWQSEWLKHNLGAFALKLFPLGGVAFCAAIVANMARRRWREWRETILYMGLAGACLLFWFLGAPDLRFGEGFLWLWMALGVTFLLESLPGAAKPRLAVAVIAMIVLVFWAGLFPRMRPHPRYWGTGHAWAHATRDVVLKNGQTPPLVVKVPAKGDQLGDAALPCTPYPRDRLMLRTPGKLRDGFRVAP